MTQDKIYKLTPEERQDIMFITQEMNKYANAIKSASVYYNMFLEAKKKWEDKIWENIGLDKTKYDLAFNKDATHLEAKKKAKKE